MSSFSLLLPFFSGIVFAFLGLTYKRAAARQCDQAGFAVVFLLTATTVTGVGTLFDTTPWDDGSLWILGVGMGACFYLALVLMLAANRRGPTSLSWMAISLSLIIPLTLSALWLGESFGVVGFLILAVFGLIVYVLRRGAKAEETALKANERASPVFWILLAALFLANGAYQFGGKLKFAWFGGAASAGYAAIVYGAALALAVAVHAATGAPRLSVREWSCGALSGVCVGVGFLLQLAAMRLSAAVVYPLSGGISMVGGVALMAIVYRERINRWKAVGLALGVVILVLSAFHG